jgi:ABC-type nitrate/sulfonate/bicarbonate transport system substrate-binding protein
MKGDDPMKLRLDSGRLRRPAGIAVLGILLALLTMLPGCERPSAPLPIRIGLAMQPGAVLMILAREQAYFEQEGLAPAYTTYPSGKRALNEGLFADQADITSASDLPAAEMLREGKDLVILSALQSARSINSIVARRDSGIARIADLTGKRVGTQQISAVHFFLDRTLQANGVESARVFHAFYPAEQLVPALAGGKIDAISMREPYVSQALAQLGANGVAFEAPWVYPQFEVLVARRGYAETHAEEMKRVLRALLRAERFLVAQPREAAAVLARSMKLSPEAAERVLAQTINRVSLSQALLPMLEKQLRWLETRSPVTARLTGNLLDALHLGSLQAVDSLRIDIAGLSQHEHP